MFEIVLFQPEIPPNTGNIIRLAANTGCRLHLVKPLGFELGDSQLRRAGLDYHEYASLIVHADWRDCRAALAGTRLFAFTTKARRQHVEATFQAGDGLLFGPETRGLPAAILGEFAEDQRLRLPMRAQSRSLNLSNAVAVVVYEAWRQNGFAGGQ
jgi:tRNA (cytidine/uridine-2'-O-)-methyltransferase